LQSAPSDQKSTPGGDARDLVLIGFLPMAMPDYLMRPQIATHLDGSRVDYAEFDRWAEPLLDTMLRLVTHGMEQALPGHRFAKFPWVANLDIRYRMFLEIEQFDLYSDGNAVLAATWAIGQGRQGPWLHVGSVNLTETFEEDKKPDYEARVAALNRLVTAMNRRLAVGLREFLAAEPTR
jgi:uncharacterized lipoprotein YmbA